MLEAEVCAYHLASALVIFALDAIKSKKYVSVFFYRWLIPGCCVYFSSGHFTYLLSVIFDVYYLSKSLTSEYLSRNPVVWGWYYSSSAHFSLIYCITKRWYKISCPIKDFIRSVRLWDFPKPLSLIILKYKGFGCTSLCPMNSLSLSLSLSRLNILSLIPKSKVSWYSFNLHCKSVVLIVGC